MTETERKIEAAIVDFCRLWMVPVDEGHIVDDWDRRFCAAYLENLMQDNLLDEAEIFPFIEGKNISFKCPPPLAYEKYIEHIE